MAEFEESALNLLLQETRFKIVRELKRAEGPLYIDELARRIGENPRLVSFHLAVLQRSGLVTSEFRVIDSPKSRGKAGRFFSLTEKANEVASRLAQEITVSS